MKRILSVLLALVMVLGMIPMVASAADTEVVFEFGANGSASHTDGSSKTTYTETVNGYTLTLSNVSNFYTGARDATGNSCIKLGTGSKTGGFKFQVPADVTKVIIKVAQYKANATQVTVNGTSYSISTASNNGAYTDIEVDTTKDKTIEVATTSSGKRAMVNSIAFVIPETTCDHANTTTTTVDATCEEAGSKTVTCNDCGNTVSYEDIAALGHNYVDGTCSRCGKTTVLTHYELVTNVASLTAGDEIIVVGSNEGKYYTMLPYDSGNNVKTAEVSAPVENVITLISESEAARITLGGDSTGWTLFDGAKYYNAPGGTGDNYLKGVATLPTNNTATWTISIDSNGVATIVNVGNSGTEARNTIKFNYGNDPDIFSCYKSGYTSNVALVSIYREVKEGADECQHTNTTDVAEVAATCTEVGYTAGVYCNDCESYISGHEVIPATGHIWVDGACDECGEAQTSEATISFASTEQRVSQDGSTQVWSNAGLTVTNNKANSTNPIIDSSNPVRFYKGSEIVIVFPGMTKIEVTCDTAAYATALKDSINDDNATVSVNDTVVTIVLSEAANSYSVQLTAGQVRVDAITVVAGTCAHVWGELVQTVAPTCTTTGTNTSTCALCGETKEETIAATGHTYNFADDSVSCDVCDFTANKTNIGDLPYANSNNLYYIEGTVTYVNGRNVYMEDATGGICVYYAANEQKDVAQGDVLRVVDSLTLYNDLLETTETLNAETQKVSSGNALPNKTITVAELLADASADKNYLGTRITLNQVTLGEIKTDGNTTITDDNGNSTIIRYMPAIEGIAAGDVVNVTAVVSIYKGTYQLLINKSTAAQDVVKCVVAPSIELTHISLDPTNDALGFKATITGDLPEGAKVGIIMSVEGGLEKTYLVDAAELKTTGVFTLRLNGIMAANGGEKKITGTPVIMIGEEAITGTPNTTSMKQTIIDVNAAWDTFKATQQAAVKELYNDYAVIMAAWLGADNKIVPPVAEAPAA